ncbi:phosphotransferase [Alicyclobacillus fodiniaquatilis]|uniref:Phosphotransferase n=1 Tax=Alicyclobacillus fodiniaquatilis TaxID=1661150 RepID=A0ABW4JMA8_9BACL
MRDKDDLTITRAVRASYNLKVDKLTWCDSLYLRRVAARLEARDKTYKLKRFAGTQQRLQTLANGYQQVAACRLHEFPTWHRTAQGKAYIRVQGQLLYLLDWVHGKPFEHTSAHAYALGRTLRKLHVPPRSRQSFTTPSLRRRIDQIEQVTTLLSNKDSTLHLPSVARDFITVQTDALVPLLKTSMRMLKELGPKLSYVMVHGDVTVPNVLMNGRTAVLIDWERLSLGFAMEELAKTVMNTCNLSIPHARALLAGYGWSSLSDDAKAAFGVFLQIPREVNYLLLRASRRRPSKADRAQWKLVMDTWAERQRLFEALVDV